MASGPVSRPARLRKSLLSCFINSYDMVDFVTKREHWTRLVVNRVKRFLKREPPEDPYAYVGAPKKPRPPLRNASVAIEPER